jgi:hypothetical protein
MGPIEKFNSKQYRLSRHKRNRRHVLIPALITTLVLILLIFILNSVNSDLRTSGYSAIIFTSFAASAFIMFMIPYSRASNVKRFVWSYLMAGVLGEIGYILTPILGLYGAVAFTLFLMSLLLFETDSVHPPAMGAALAFVIFRVGYPELIILVSGIIVLSVIKMFVERLGINP